MGHYSIDIFTEIGYVFGIFLSILSNETCSLLISKLKRNKIKNLNRKVLGKTTMSFCVGFPTKGKVPKSCGRHREVQIVCAFTRGVQKQKGVLNMNISKMFKM